MGFSHDDQLRGHKASLESRRRTKRWQESIHKVCAMTPEDRGAFKASSGYDQLAKACLEAAIANPKLSIVVLKEFRDTQGERIGSNWKETKERNDGQPDIIVDLPRPKRDPETTQ